MKELPLVSVVTPSLNQGEFIQETIESVLSQNYPRIEYIVMDGGSTDRTLKILQTYGERLYWVSEPDHGQSHAVNKGWRLAQGEIVTWLNADDLFIQDAVSNAVLAFESSHDDLAAVYGDCDYIDKKGEYLGKYPSQPFDYDQLVRLTEDFIPQPGTFIRSLWAKQVGMLDENLHFVMDYDLWLRLGMRAKLEYLPQKMAYARLHGGAKTLSSAPLFGEELASVFSQLVVNPEFPIHLLQNRDSILAKAFVHAASYCFWGGETTRARYFLFRAWRQAPFIRIRSFWRLLLFSLAGRAGWRLAERLHGNPFRFEKGLMQ
jgi:glycosyltransferase involved in cell wall biosynthesis